MSSFFSRRVGGSLRRRLSICLSVMTCCSRRARRNVYTRCATCYFLNMYVSQTYMFRVICRVFLNEMYTLNLSYFDQRCKRSRGRWKKSWFLGICVMFSFRNLGLPYSSVRPEIRFRSIRSIFSDPVPVRFRLNTDRIDRIWLVNLGVVFDIMQHFVCSFWPFSIQLR